MGAIACVDAAHDLAVVSVSASQVAAGRLGGGETAVPIDVAAHVISDALRG